MTGGRTWHVRFGALGALTLLAATLSLALQSASGDSTALNSRLTSSEKELERLQARIDQLTTRGPSDEGLAHARRPFEPEVLTAVAQVRTDLIAGSCVLGRSAGRNGQTPSDTQRVKDYVFASVSSKHPALGQLDDWQSLVDTSGLQQETQRCFALEVARIREETRVAKEAARTADDRRHQQRVRACASGETSACTYLGPGELDDLCRRGSAEACAQRNLPLTPDEVEEKERGAKCRWRSDDIPGHLFNLDTGEEIFDAPPGFNPC